MLRRGSFSVLFSSYDNQFTTFFRILNPNPAFFSSLVIQLCSSNISYVRKIRKHLDFNSRESKPAFIFQNKEVGHGLHTNHISGGSFLIDFEVKEYKNQVKVGDDRKQSQGKKGTITNSSAIEADAY